MSDSQEREYQDVSKPRQVHPKIKWKVSQDAIYCINLRKAQDKGQKLWQTRSNAILLKDSVPVDCVERVVNTKTEEILCQIVSFISTLATTQLLWRIPGRFSSAWCQYGETLDFRIQGIPQAAVEQEDERTRGIKRLVHLCKNHPDKSASIKDLQTTGTYNPFSEESKKVIHIFGGTWSTKTRCSNCSK